MNLISMNSQGITHIEKTPRESCSNVHGQIQNASINLSKNPKTKTYSNVKGDYKQHITNFSSPNPHWKEKNVFQASTYIGKFKRQIGTTNAFNKMYISIKKKH